MNSIRKYFQGDKFAEHSGIELVEVAPGKARARMKIESHHLNGVGIVHGGAVFTLADLAFAVASNSHGTVALAINANISFIKAGTRGTLYADAVEISRNHRLASYTVTVTDTDGATIAIFQGMVYRKKDPIPS